MRFDLDGQPTAAVTPEQRETAAKKVKKLEAKAAKAAKKRDGK